MLGPGSPNRQAPLLPRERFARPPSLQSREAQKVKPVSSQTLMRPPVLNLGPIPTERRALALAFRRPLKECVPLSQETVSGVCRKKASCDSVERVETPPMKSFIPLQASPSTTARSTSRHAPARGSTTSKCPAPSISTSLASSFAFFFAPT